MKRPSLREDVACALSEAQGARQATRLLQDQVRALADDLEAIKVSSLNVSAIRVALTDHLAGSHVHSHLGSISRRRRSRPAS